VSYLGSRDSLDNLIIPVVPAADLGDVATLPSEQPEMTAERETGAAMWAIVLGGGIGSRFWPLSC
jgi:hypothetical protein